MKHRKQRLNINRLIKKDTRRQYKVHNEQMSPYDINKLAELIIKIDLDKVKLSSHVKKKHDSRFQIQLFHSLLEDNSNIHSQIIEYNEIPITIDKQKVIDKRVLLRDYSDVDGMNLCFVLSLVTNKIVTAYWIEKDFTHAETLNWGRYSSTFYISAYQ